MDEKELMRQVDAEIGRLQELKRFLALGSGLSPVVDVRARGDSVVALESSRIPVVESRGEEFDHEFKPIKRAAAGNSVSFFQGWDGTKIFIVGSMSIAVVAILVLVYFEVFA